MITLSQATDTELVAAWNVLQFSLKMISDKSDIYKELSVVSKELEHRGIQYENGKRIVKVK